jgi:predicted alpha/beta-fold hydrolase
VHIRSFNTPRWLRNNHLQTAWGSFFRKKQTIKAERLFIPLRDGVCLAADYVLPSHQSEERIEEVLLLLHGLTGSSESHYVVGFQKAILNAGLNVATIAINHRGSLGINCPALTSPTLYHAGVETDIQDCIAFVRERWPSASIRALGVSLSGNMLVRALGLNLLPELASAMAISVPFELQAASNQVDKGLGLLYRRYLVNRMQGIVALKKKHSSSLNMKCAVDQYCSHSLSWGKLRSFWGMDNFIIGPLHGFRNVHHYYREASSRHLIQHIRQPLLIIQAADDPLVPTSAWPASSQIPDNVEFEAYDRGGHVGFISPEGYWLEHRVLRWLAPEADFPTPLPPALPL